MSEFGWLTKAPLSSRDSSNKIKGVSDSSMMQLRAVVADHASNGASVGRYKPTTKHNINIEKRIQKDEDDLDAIILQSDQRKMKHVKSSLEKKAELYDNLYSDGTVRDDKEFMVDFSRKRQSRDMSKAYSAESSTTGLVQVTDEFGRAKMVKENSVEYRLFLATESKKLRMEGIQNAPGFGSGDGVNETLGWRVDDDFQPVPTAASVAVQRNYGDILRQGPFKQIPFAHDSKRYDYRPMTEYEKYEVMDINDRVEDHRALLQGEARTTAGRGSHSYNTSRKGRKDARLALIQKKSKKRKENI